jgi:hypothetical protein
MWRWARVWKKKVAVVAWRARRVLTLSLRKPSPVRRRKTAAGLPRPQRKLAAILSVATPVSAIFCLFFGWYALPRYSRQWETQPAMIMLSSPRYLAFNEEEEIRVAVRNESDIPIQVNLKLSGSITVPAFIEYNGTNVISAGEIRGGEQIERRVKVMIPYDFGGGLPSRPAGLALRGNVEGKIVRQSLPISVIPFPWARKLFGAFFTALAAVIAWIAKEWWDITKEASGKIR